MSTVTHKLADTYCKMIVVAGRVPILVAVEEQDGDTNEILEQYVKLVKSCFSDLPETAQEQIVRQFLSMDSVGDPGHGTILVKSGWGGATYEFDDRTVTLHTENYINDRPQGVYEAFSAVVMSEVRCGLDEAALAQAWRNPNGLNGSRLISQAQEIADELKTYLHKVPAL